MNYKDTLLPTMLFMVMLFSLPVWFWLIRKNELVRETMFDGWVPILLAMVISRQVNEFKPIVY